MQMYFEWVSIDSPQRSVRRDRRAFGRLLASKRLQLLFNLTERGADDAGAGVEQPYALKFSLGLQAPAKDQNLGIREQLAHRLAGAADSAKVPRRGRGDQDRVDRFLLGEKFQLTHLFANPCQTAIAYPVAEHVEHKRVNGIVEWKIQHQKLLIKFLFAAWRSTGCGIGSDDLIKNVPHRIDDRCLVVGGQLAAPPIILGR